MLIGCGRHAVRNLLPFLVENSKDPIVLVDLEPRIVRLKKLVEELYPLEFERFDLYSVKDGTGNTLDSKTSQYLREIADLCKTDKIIVSTNPETHVMYARWALANQFNLLIDKPLSAPTKLKNSLEAIESIRGDYDLVFESLANARKINPHLVCNVLAQRRYHYGFDLVRQLVDEIVDISGVGITAFEASHSDGQWRLPKEIIYQDYHPYNSGYGKCLHSGYHTIDTAQEMLERSWGKKITSTDLVSNFVYPEDYLEAFPSHSQYEILGEQLSEQDRKHLDEHFKDKSADKFGEISAQLSISYMNHNNKKIAIGNIGMYHDGVSQRSWPSAEGRDLYKGNGRLRHESLNFISGPLQTVKVISLESSADEQLEGTGIGESGNFDLHVFRNSALFPAFKQYEHISSNQIFNKLGKAPEDMMRSARNNGLQDFFSCVSNEKISARSDYNSHRNTTNLLYASYLSAFLRRNGENFLVRNEVSYD